MEARRKPEYWLVLGDQSQVGRFRAKLMLQALFINHTLQPPLQDADVRDVVDRLVETVAKWKHDSEHQRARQKKQAASRRKKTRGRDLQIIRHHQNGMSQRDIARKMNISRAVGRRAIDLAQVDLAAHKRKHDWRWALCRFAVAREGGKLGSSP